MIFGIDVILWFATHWWDLLELSCIAIILISISYEMYLNYKAHQVIVKVFENHRKSIEALNKLVKRLEKDLKSAESEISKFQKDVPNTNSKLQKIESALIDPDNIEFLKIGREIENKKQTLQIQRIEKHNEQKQRKELLRNKTIQKTQI